MKDQPLASSTSTRYSVTIPSRGPTVHVYPKRSEDLDLESDDIWDEKHGMGRSLEETRQYYNLETQSIASSRQSLSSHPLATSLPPASASTPTTAFTNGILPPKGFFAPQRPGGSSSSNGLHIPSPSSSSNFPLDASTPYHTLPSPQSSLAYTSHSANRPQHHYAIGSTNDITNRYGDPDGMHGSDRLPSGVASSPSKGESLYVSSTPSKVYGHEGRWREASEDTQFGSSSVGRGDDLSGMNWRYGTKNEFRGRIDAETSPTASREMLIRNKLPTDFDPSVVNSYPYQGGSSSGKPIRPDAAAQATSSRQKLFEIKRHSIMSTISSRPSSQPPRPTGPEDRSSNHPPTPLAATTTALAESTEQPTNAMRKRVRKHTLHQGNNSFALGGRLVTGGDSTPLPLLLSFVIELGLGALWVGTTGVYVWRKGVGGQGGGTGVGVVVVFLWIWGVSFGAMLGTAFRDPGIIPRNLDPSPAVAPTASTGSLVPLPKELRVRSGRVTVKYCETCCIYRPPRSSHCRICGNCVEGIDHHCTYLHTCVGRRNYTSFIAFVVFSFLCLVYAIVWSAIHLYLLTKRDGGRSFREALSEDPGSAVAFSLGILLIGPIGTLMSYHVRLMFKNSTTIEEIRRSAIRSTERTKKRNILAFWRRPGEVRGKDRSGENPYASPFRFARWYTNMSRMLCRPNTPSWMGFSDWTDDRTPGGQETDKW